MKNKPFVKICGITRQSDLKCVVKSGADAVGFIAFPKSPRYTSPEEVKFILNKVDTKDCLKVAVFVNEDLDEIQEYLKMGIDIVQLHGDETADFASAIDSEVWRAIRLREEAQMETFKDYPCSKFLIDSFVKDSAIPGGTGHVANWELAQKFVQAVDKDVLLAGGITRKNFAEALQEVKPFGLDLSSGVEKSPGIKDQKKVIELFDSLNSLFC